MSGRYRLLFPLFFFPFIAVSQTAIRGNISDAESKNPVEGAVISIVDESNEVLSYGVSDRKGDFMLSVNSQSNTFRLVCRMLGYSDYSLSIENKTQEVLVALNPSAIELKEVTIKATPITIKEDTLAYSVSAFKTAGDRTIGDVLKKMPGIEVKPGGGIAYQGEPINKFYIEGLDLLENKYGIATNNVPVDAVLNVEVIENHQPVQSIKGMISSAQAAINLKLRDDKKARPVGGVRAGGGKSDEWNWLLEVFTLLATKKRQTIAMYKTNNTGLDIGMELNEQTLSMQDLQDPSSGLEKDLLLPSESGNPPIEQERYLFNKTHLASVNNLWKTGADRQFRININYLNDVQHENSSLRSEYFLPDSTLIVIEDNALKKKQQLFSGTLTYTDNSSSYFLENAFNWKIKQSENHSSVFTYSDSVEQDFHTPTTSFRNELKYLRKWGDRLWNINSYVSFTNQPEALTVYRDNAISRQNIDLYGFFTRNSSYYSWFWGRSSIRLNALMEASLNTVGTDLVSSLVTDSLASDFQSTALIFELSPAYTYKTEKSKLELTLPFRYQSIGYDNKRKSDGTQTTHYFLYNARISYSRTFHPFFSSRIAYHYLQNTGDYMDYLDSYTMKNYRNYFISSGVISLRKSHTLSLSLNYKNPLNNLFINAAAAYIPSESNKTAARRFVGEVYINSEILKDNRTNIWMGRFYLGKYFSHIKTNIGLTSDYHSSQLSRFQQDVLYPMEVNTLRTTISGNTKLSDWLTFVYRCNWVETASLIKGSGTSYQSSFTQIGQQFKTYVSLSKKLSFNLQLEHTYNEIGKDTSVDIFLANIAASYKLENVDFDLSWNNLFNKKEYAYSFFNGLETYMYRYAIRPMSVILTASFKY
ncbi:carboxypeptidase-like regulatory domain-containing protein [Limibacterium fermenti]|uniref:TonB-dependent receptor n=1 Tax=Limibacterium fermenti TaxID=3229863 RepID=UPI000E832BAF|nr:hypothetical protein [Porphyromonadaceae bacterium]